MTGIEVAYTFHALHHSIFDRNVGIVILGHTWRSSELEIPASEVATPMYVREPHDKINYRINWLGEKYSFKALSGYHWLSSKGTKCFTPLLFLCANLFKSHGIFGSKVMSGLTIITLVKGLKWVHRCPSGTDSCTGRPSLGSWPQGICGQTVPSSLLTWVVCRYINADIELGCVSRAPLMSGICTSWASDLLCAHAQLQILHFSAVKIIKE